VSEANGLNQLLGVMVTPNGRYQLLFYGDQFLLTKPLCLLKMAIPTKGEQSTVQYKV